MICVKISNPRIFQARETHAKRSKGGPGLAPIKNDKDP